MAGAAGFEPANVDSKNRCLTAWRRPIQVNLSFLIANFYIKTTKTLLNKQFSYVLLDNL